MNKKVNSLIINLGLLISGLVTIFSGLLIQVKYHIGNHGNAELRNFLGLSYKSWTDIHKVSIVIFTMTMIFHIYLHWKWYKAVILKRLIKKNQQVIVLSVLFFFVSISGLIPWFIDLVNGNQVLRKSIIEVHDKLAIIFSIYLILHIINRVKWFFFTFKRN